MEKVKKANGAGSKVVVVVVIIMEFLIVRMILFFLTTRSQWDKDAVYIIKLFLS